MRAIKKPKCTCVADVDKLMKPNHTHVVTAVFSGKVGIRTELDYDAPKRVRAVSLVATFCPFCGVKYPNVASTAKRKLKAVPK
jgi:hypothetical protein